MEPGEPLAADRARRPVVRLVARIRAGTARAETTVTTLECVKEATSSCAVLLLEKNRAWDRQRAARVRSGLSKGNPKGNPKGSRKGRPKASPRGTFWWRDVQRAASAHIGLTSIHARSFCAVFSRIVSSYLADSSPPALRRRRVPTRPRPRQNGDGNGRPFGPRRQSHNCFFLNDEGTHRASLGGGGRTTTTAGSVGGATSALHKQEREVEEKRRRKVHTSPQRHPRPPRATRLRRRRETIRGCEDPPRVEELERSAQRLHVHAEELVDLFRYDVSHNDWAL